MVLLYNILLLLAKIRCCQWYGSCIALVLTRIYPYVFWLDINIV